MFSLQQDSRWHGPPTLSLQVDLFSVLLLLLVRDLLPTLHSRCRSISKRCVEYFAEN